MTTPMRDSISREEREVIVTRRIERQRLEAAAAASQVTGPTTGVPNRLVDALRWAAVIPAAFLVAGLAHTAYIFVSQLIVRPFLTPNTFLDEFSERTVSNLLFGGLMVSIAAKVAPRYKSHVGMFVAGLFVAALLGLWISGLGVRSAWDVYAILVAVAAAIYTCADLAKRERVANIPQIPAPRFGGDSVRTATPPNR